LLVTHKKPDLDAMASVYLWLKAHSIPWDAGEDVYQMVFVNPGQRLKADQGQQENFTIVHFDTGRELHEYNFDHHQLETREKSATGLVWERLYRSGENPAIDELAKIINHTDNGIQYSTEDLVARHIFGLGFWLSGANKLFPESDDYNHTMNVGFSLLDAYLANHGEVEVFHQLTQDMDICETQLGKTAVLSDVPGDSSAIRSYLKRYYNGERGPLVNTCIAKFQRGSIGVVVCIDPNKQEQLDFYDENDDYPETVSLNQEMELIYKKLKEIDPSSHIYLHYSRFSLYVNRSHIIRLEDILKIVGLQLN
jgi:hypothetical protein